MIPGSSQTSGRVALGRIWTERKRKNYNSQRPTRVTQHQTRGRQRPGLETDADRRVFPYIHVDFARSREEVTDRKLRDHGHEPGSGAHRQKTGQNGAQEEHGEGQLTGSTFICSNRGTFWMNDQPGCVCGGGSCPHMLLCVRDAGLEKRLHESQQLLVWKPPGEQHCRSRWSWGAVRCSGT